MYSFIYHTILTAKYFGILLVAAIFPTESIMPFAGYTAAAGHLWLPGAIAAGAIGSTFGSIVLYIVARQLSPKAVRRFCNNYGCWLGITSRRVARAGNMFDAHARATVFLGRFIPGIRSAVSIPAGYQRMPFRSFVLFTALGSLLCSAALGFVGYYAKTSLQQLQSIAVNSTYLFAAVIVAMAGLTLLTRKVRRGRQHQVLK